MRFSKIRNVKTPEKGTPKSACFDLRCPEIDAQFIEDIQKLNSDEKSKTNWSGGIGNGEIYLCDRERILIPSGIKFAIPEDMCLVVYNKGGVSGVKGIDHLSEVIDEDYQSEVFISLINVSGSIFKISSNMKLIQVKLERVEPCELVEVEPDSLYTETTVRGGGKLGSTGTH